VPEEIRSIVEAEAAVRGAVNTHVILYLQIEYSCFSSQFFLHSITM
jgi:hypothetical protein